MRMRYSGILHSEKDSRSAKFAVGSFSTVSAGVLISPSTARMELFVAMIGENKGMTNAQVCPRQG